MPHFRSPLVLLPVIETPFVHIAMDLMGGQFFFLVLDYATQYPEATPLQNTSSKVIAKELFQVFSRMGVLKEILVDQGTLTFSKIIKSLFKLFKIRHLHTSVYHSQTWPS